MKIQYRKLTQDDSPVFIKMRINQLQEEGAEPSIDLEPKLIGLFKAFKLR